jgi:hypothetical protein
MKNEAKVGRENTPAGNAYSNSATFGFIALLLLAVVKKYRSIKVITKKSMAQANKQCQNEPSTGKITY